MPTAYNQAQYKNLEEDEYVPHDGTESRQLVKILPETMEPNGPPSCRVNGDK
jgi:hypothetical protein